MKRRYTRFLAAISIAIAGAGLFIAYRGYSCGPSLGTDQDMFTLFQRDLLPDAGMEPFAYTEEYLNSSAPDPAENDRRRNCEEWRSYTGGAASYKAIKTVLYDVPPEEYLYACRTGKWGGMADNSFAQWLCRKEHKEAARYVAFARWVEYTNSNEDDPWGEKRGFYGYYSGGEPDISKYDSLTDAALKECRASKGFLQERYAFQAVKLGYYRSHTLADTVHHESRYNDTALACYERYLKDKSTILADWGLIYYANMQTSDERRMYYLLQAFDRTDEKKIYVYIYARRKDLDMMERTTADKNIQTVIAAIKGVKTAGPAMEYIQKIYSLDPHSKYLPILVSREVNKLEDWIWSYEMKGFGSTGRSRVDSNYSNQFAYDRSPQQTDRYYLKNRRKDEQYMERLRGYLEQMATGDDSVANYMRLAIVHLYHLQRNYAAALPYLDKIKVRPGTPYARQLCIEQLLSLIYARDVADAGVKEQLATLFTRLEEEGGADRKVQTGDVPGDDGALDQLYLLLSREYRKKGDMVTASLLFQQGNVTMNEYYGYSGGCRNVDTLMDEEYMDGAYYHYISYLDKFGQPEDVDKVLAFKHKGKYTAFEERLVPCRWPSDDVYLDLKGTLLIRQERYKDALAVFNKVRPDFWHNTYVFRQYLRRNTVTSVGSLLPVVNGNGQRYATESKQAITQEIVTLQDSLAHATADSVKAHLYFMLGNCYYNISYRGKDWMMYNYGKSSGESEQWSGYYQFSFYTASRRQYDNYYRCAAAMDMYKQARAYAGKDAELAAQCLLMQALCDDQVYDHKQSLAHRYSYNDEPYISPYITILAHKYAKTRVYDWGSDCPDIYNYQKKMGLVPR